jgi:hypothetical protein
LNAVNGTQPPALAVFANAYFCAALAASQSFWVISLKPCPLQEFWPLQEFFADLQDDWPLQALTPSQCTFASSADAIVNEPTLNNSAAAVARAAPEMDLDMGM